MLNELKNVNRIKQWQFLTTLIQMNDHKLLNTKTDYISIWDYLKNLPNEFSIYAE